MTERSAFLLPAYGRDRSSVPGKLWLAGCAIRKKENRNALQASQTDCTLYQVLKDF